jgi:hypothetical protein
MSNPFTTKFWSLVLSGLCRPGTLNSCLIRTGQVASSLTILAALVLWPAPGSAQQAAPSTHVPIQKTIGQAREQIVPSLIVLNSRSASLEGNKLILKGAAPNSIVFADRPVRAAGHTLTSNLLEEWAPTNDDSSSFAKDPPNATVSAFSKDGSIIRDAVVTLKTAKLEGDQLSFDIDVLQGDLKGADGPASVFIDRFGFGGFHGGFGGFHGGYVGGGFGRVGVGRVGVWDHPYVARGAWYRGAAVGAAVGAAAAAPYYGGYGYPNQCGYYPYPPCY